MDALFLISIRSLGSLSSNHPGHCIYLNFSSLVTLYSSDLCSLFLHSKPSFWIYHDHHVSNNNPNKANLGDLIAATGLIILLKLDSAIDFSARDLEIWWIISNPLVNSNWSYSRETTNSGQNWRFLFRVEIWWMTLENNRVPLLYYIKFCASFQSHWWIQTGVTVRKRLISIRVKIGDFFLSRLTLKFDRWPWKTIAHLFYTMSSFVHHFKAMGEFTWSYILETLNLGQNRWFFCPVWPWDLVDDLGEQ